MNSVWPHADYLNHLSDYSLCHQFLSIDSALRLQPFAVVYQIFAPCSCNTIFYRSKLFQGGERRLVGEIILADAISATWESQSTSSSWRAAFACG